jgi:ASC-1-like (ASCH) protein
MRLHELKILPEYFHAVRDGIKTFEIRENDRKFQLGDDVLLHEYDPDNGGYTGYNIKVIITYISDYMQSPGYVVFAFIHYDI